MSSKARQHRSRHPRGQGMTEYIIIIALIAIATIAIVTLYGDNIRGLFGTSADSLAGDINVEARTLASPGAGAESKNMGNFADQGGGGCAGGVCPIP